MANPLRPTRRPCPARSQAIPRSRRLKPRPHGSFARAAEELARTEGAVSRQIGRLEAFLGVTLFERIGNRVRLAPNGARAMAQVREILDRLERDSLYLMGQPIEGASLDIAAIPTFATRWLIPRLKHFQARHPNITVHIAERMEPFLLAGSGFDAAIHFEHPAWAGCICIRCWRKCWCQSAVRRCSPAREAVAGCAAASSSATESRRVASLCAGGRHRADHSALIRG